MFAKVTSTSVKQGQLSDMFEESLQQSQPNYTESDFAGMIPAELKQLSKWIPGISVCPAHLTQRFKNDKGEYLWTQADATFARDLADKKAAAAVARPLDAIRKGGDLKITATGITVHGGKDVEFCAGAVPSTIKARYSNLSVMAVAISSFIKQKNGNLIPFHSSSNLKALATLLEGTTLNYRAFESFGTFLSTIIMKDQEWMGMADTTRSTISGPQLVLFVKDWLNRLAPMDYFTLNNKLAIDVFALWHVVGTGESVRVTANPAAYTTAFPWLSEEEVELLGFDYDSFVPRKQFGPGFVKFVGVQKPTPIKMMMSTDSLKKAIDLKQLVQQAFGGKKAVSYLISRAKGFYGLATDQERRVSFTVSASVACWYRKEIPLITLVSAGDLPLIESALEVAATIVKGMHKQKKEEMNEGYVLEPAEESCIWNYMDSLEVRKYLPDTLKAKLGKDNGVGNVRKVIFFGASTIKDKTAELTETSLLNAGGIQEMEGKFVAYGMISGPRFFPDDKSEVQANALKLHNVSPFARAYVFGTAAHFEGVFTDLGTSSWTMVGRRPEGALEKIDLVSVVNLVDWYKRVAAHLAEMVAYWQVAPNFFSSTMNWLCMTKKTVSAMDTIEILDESILPCSDIVKQMQKEELVSVEVKRPGGKVQPAEVKKAEPEPTLARPKKGPKQYQVKKPVEPYHPPPATTAQPNSSSSSSSVTDDLFS